MENNLINAELEQQLLGGMLAENDLYRLADDMPLEVFADPVHRDLFAEIRSRLSEGTACDASTLRFAFSGHAGLQQLGGAEYLVRLQLSAVGLSGFQSYVDEAKSLYARRIATEALSAALERLAKYEAGVDAEKILSGAEAAVSEAVAQVQSKPLTQSFLSAMASAIEGMSAAYQNGSAVGVSTGLMALDKRIGAMAEGELIVLAGRPSMGKSAIAWNVAMKAAMRGEGVFFASLEMTADQLAMRGLSQVLASQGRRVPYSDMKRGGIDEGQFRSTMETAVSLEALPIITCDPSCRELGKLKAAIRDASRRLEMAGHPLKMIVVDYLGLVNPIGLYRQGDANGRVTAVCEALKAIAMHYRVPVLALSQLNRSVEHRDPPVPMLSDLRDSGAIEQDADIVLFAYRPEYYITKKIEAAASADASERADLEQQLSTQRNKLYILNAKQRGGATGSATVYCDLSMNVICDFADIPKFHDEEMMA